jgi:hypothetical protein
MSQGAPIPMLANLGCDPLGDPVAWLVELLDLEVPDRESLAIGGEDPDPELVLALEANHVETLGAVDGLSHLVSFVCSAALAIISHLDRV